MISGSTKKRRVGSSGRLSSFGDIDSSKSSDGTLTGSSGFNDPSTADVILRLYYESSPFEDDPETLSSSVNSVNSVDQGDVQLHLHSNVLRRSKYFAALLSDRWQRKSDSGEDSENSHRVYDLNLKVSSTIGSFNNHLTVLQLLYTNNFSTIIDSVSTALSILPVALELLFEDCVKACVRFLEAVPWSEEEEKKVLAFVPLLKQEESQELLARVSPTNSAASEDMLHGLIVAAIHNHSNMALVKAFVAKLLRDFSSRDSAKRVLDQAFHQSLKIVKESLEEYSSPDFRGDYNDPEAIQRVNLHTAMTNGKHLYWLVERMIELRVADTAVKEWSDQSSFTADLQRAFRDDACRNIAPGLQAVMLRCTCKLANAVAAGSIVAARLG
ncbi:BTB/POZ domain-containing protein At1g63850-like isoform X2 [Telopea speciosissima]|uniref:BTB/POZ domain-containing protein At1g63850-like isoform X2 n=1 Tax=Telopea speciosissima TaxID=54955 RepID=UPI001CC7F4C5|nr:BTB/POZ domain-containing protein At1g63850-like isoform X2 [Telopea speciosissima]